MPFFKKHRVQAKATFEVFVSHKPLLSESCLSIILLSTVPKRQWWLNKYSLNEFIYLSSKK